MTTGSWGEVSAFPERVPEPRGPVGSRHSSEAEVVEWNSARIPRLLFPGSYQEDVLDMAFLSPSAALSKQSITCVSHMLCCVPQEPPRASKKKQVNLISIMCLFNLICQFHFSLQLLGVCWQLWHSLACRGIILTSASIFFKTMLFTYF